MTNLLFVAFDFGLVEGSDMVDWVPNFKRPYPWLGEMMMMDVSSLDVAFHFLLFSFILDSKWLICLTNTAYGAFRYLTTSICRFMVLLLTFN